MECRVLFMATAIFESKELSVRRHTERIRLRLCDAILSENLTFSQYTVKFDPRRLTLDIDKHPKVEPRQLARAVIIDGKSKKSIENTTALFYFELSLTENLRMQLTLIKILCSVLSLLFGKLQCVGFYCTLQSNFI